MKVKMEQPNELLVDDLESLLRDIGDFTTSASKSEEIPSTLENYLLFVARTGNTVFPWQHVRTLFRVKMLSAINQFGGESSTTEAFVLERFDLFRAAPFTIQRFTELITQPNRHYKKKEKFLRGLEKTVLVVSTVDPKPVRDDVKNGNENSNSSADADTDQGFSEGDEQSNNRTFVLDQHEDLVTSAGPRGEVDTGAGSSDSDTVSSTNLGSSVIAAASKALTDSLQPVTGIDGSKMLQTDRTKMTELYRSYDDVNASTTTVSSGVTSQLKLYSSNAIIDVVSVSSEQHNVLRDGDNEFVTHQHRANLVEISSSDGDFNATKSTSVDVEAPIDENGNPPKGDVASEVCNAIPAIEQGSPTPMEVDEEMETSSSSLYNIDSEPIESVATLQDISTAPPAASCLEKDVMTSTDEGIPVSSELSSVAEPVTSNEGLVTEFTPSVASPNTNLDITCDNVIVSEGQEFTELKSQSNLGSGSALEYENENRLVELNTAVIQTTSAVENFIAEGKSSDSDSQLSSSESQYPPSSEENSTGINPTEQEQDAAPVEGESGSASTDLREEN